MSNGGVDAVVAQWLRHLTVPQTGMGSNTLEILSSSTLKQCHFSIVFFIFICIFCFGGDEVASVFGVRIVKNALLALKNTSKATRTRIECHSTVKQNCPLDDQFLPRSRECILKRALDPALAVAKRFTIATLCRPE